MNKVINTLFLAIIVILIGLFILFINSKQKNITDYNNKKQLIVSILPQKQIVEKIVNNNNFIVDVLIPPGFSPETYDPTTQEMQKVARAEMYFRIGKIPFEEVNLKKLIDINQKMVVVDTSEKNTFITIEKHSHENEESQDTKTSDHEEQIDPHIWLSPRMVKEQAEVIYRELVKKYPEYTQSFTTNYKQLEKDLDILDQELNVAFTTIKGKTMLVYHPAFGYLAKDYGFHQEYIQIEGKEPSINELQDIIIEAKKDDVRVIFVQKQFSKDSAQAIAANINGVVVEVDPLDADYFNNMRTIAQIITDALRK